MKSILKSFLVSVLGSQVKRLRSKNNFKVIGVVGSIGKTSTKLAIAKVLACQYKVRFQEGNYNDILSVPLIFFGQKMPNLWNVFGWVKIILENEIQIIFKYDFDFVVVELGTDGPNQILQFRKYLHLDVAILTSTTQEHMEFFLNIENVIKEEWSVIHFSNLVFANKDLCPVFPEKIDFRKVIFYGKNFGSVYKIEDIDKRGEDLSFKISYQDKEIIDLMFTSISEVSIYSVSIAAIVATFFNVPKEKIKYVIKDIKSFSGRMQKLVGLNNSIIIDDTYNSSPKSLEMALNTLFDYNKEKKIAVLGSMNELGETSPNEHRKIGRLCDPKKINFLVTVGNEANLYIAEEASKLGCNVYKAKNALDAAGFISEYLDKNTVALFKGSQNGVFLEESIKILLKNKSDVSKLVRQDKDWLKKKLTFMPNLI